MATKVTILDLRKGISPNQTLRENVMNELKIKMATHESAIAVLVAQVYELIKPYNPQHAECFISERFHRELNIKAFLGGFTNKENSTFKLVGMLADELETRQEYVNIINSMLEA